MWTKPPEIAVWSYLLKKTLMENVIFCAMVIVKSEQIANKCIKLK